MDRAQFAEHVDSSYFDWMTGRSGDAQDDDQAQVMLLTYLGELAKSDLAGSDLIPRIPGVMQELLKNMRDENVSTSDLAALIKKDVVLLVAVLKEANSALYSPRSPIIDLNKAIQLLGHNGLRLVLAKAATRPIFNAKLGNFTKQSGPRIWEHTEARAIACSLLAKQRGIDQFQAFLAGLMQDVGLMVALRVFDRAEVNGALSTSATFRKSLRKQSRILSSQIGRVWELPQPVLQAITEQDSDKHGFDWSALGQLLRMGDFISKACVLVNSGGLLEELGIFKEVLPKEESDCLFALIKVTKLN
ncbi:MAG TPA: HDOD domain-containing protein [Burkholderiaceae bacterium]